MYDLAVIGAVGFAAWQGSRAGILAAALVGIEMIVSAVAGVLFHELLAGLLVAGLRLAAEPFLPSEFPYQGVAVPLAFSLLTWGTFAGLRFRFHEARDPMSGDDQATVHSAIERAAGALVGGCSGLIVAGAVLVTLSMLPVPAGLRLDPQRMLFDAGGLVLRMAGEFEPDRHEGVSLIVRGEPASRSSDPSALLVSEPRVAGPDAENPDEGARFSDVDGNGNYTEDLYFLDLDGDRLRRAGLLDKYAVGVWSGMLDAHARERPKPPTGDRDPAAGSSSGQPARKTEGRRPGATSGPTGGPKPGNAQPVDDF
jgi:hypothetical protein